MVQRFKETSHPVFTSAKALSRGILRMLKGKETIYFNADASNTDLLFPIIHSVNQLRIYGAVSNWCHQFGSTMDEKGQEQILAKGESVNKEILKIVNSQDGLNSYLETDCGKTFKTSNHCPRQFNSQRVANSHRSGTGYLLV